MRTRPYRSPRPALSPPEPQARLLQLVIDGIRTAIRGSPTLSMDRHLMQRFLRYLNERPRERKHKNLANKPALAAALGYT
jgi:hypothetical protein